MDTKQRILMLLQFLKENTDEETSASNNGIRKMFQFAGEMTVIAPEYVCEQYARKLQAAIDDVLGSG